MRAVDYNFINQWKVTGYWTCNRSLRKRHVWINFSIWRLSRGAGLAQASIVSDYGLDDRAIGVRSPAEAKDFPLASVSRPALGPTQPPVQWIPVVLSPGAKRGRGVMLTTHPHLVPRSWISRSYTSSPQIASMACSGTALITLLYGD
jgi:hypothetical protein